MQEVECTCRSPPHRSYLTYMFSQYYRQIQFFSLCHKTAVAFLGVCLSPAGAPQLCVLSAVFGLDSHLGYFIHGDHHLQAPNIVHGFFSAIAVLYALLLKFPKYGTFNATRVTALMVGAYFAALGTSMAIYRLFFHQLRYFPGPKLAAVSKLYHVSKLGKYDNFKLLDRWHRKYGDWERIGK